MITARLAAAEGRPFSEPSVPTFPAGGPLAAHLLRGLADAVAHGLHVALLLLQLLLQLGDPGLQATLLILQGIPEGGQPRGPVPLPGGLLGGSARVTLPGRDPDGHRDLLSWASAHNVQDESNWPWKS